MRQSACDDLLSGLVHRWLEQRTEEFTIAGSDTCVLQRPHDSYLVTVHHEVDFIG